MTWAYIVIVAMIVCSAYFSASEIAFNASNKLRLRRAAESGETTAKVAYRISENFTLSLSAILIGNNLANIAVSTCTTLIVMQLFSGNDGLASTIATAIVTVVILIFGEIVPKILAKQHADLVVRWVAIPTKILTLILMPIVFVVMLLIGGLRKLWGTDKEEDAPSVTEEELSTIIDTVEEEGVIDEDQSELLQSTLEFADITLERIMTHRVDVVAIDIDDDPKEIAATLRDPTQYSRLPVYEETIDNIIGVLTLTRYYKATLEDKNPDIRSILLPTCKLHKTMRLPAALERLREEKIHLAVVIDEFGGTLGIVTMEDILEELVGDIWDDTDVIEVDCRKVDENTFEVVGDMNLQDCFEEIDFEAPEDFSCEYTTIGGFAIENLNADPHVGDSFSYQNLVITVTEMDEELVTKLNILVNPVEEDEEE